MQIILLYRRLQCIALSIATLIGAVHTGCLSQINLRLNDLNNMVIRIVEFVFLYSVKILKYIYTVSHKKLLIKSCRKLILRKIYLHR